MRYIGRWSLMRNALPENIQEHSHMVAVIAHALGIIRRDVFGEDCNPEECAAVALKPEIESCFEIHGEKTINYHTKRIAAESYAYDSLDQLCAAMPSDWRQAIKDAVQRGDSFSSTDLDGNYVTFYTMDKNLPCVSPRDLKSPAARALAESVGTKYYQIIEYDNGQYRFGFWYEYG